MTTDSGRGEYLLVKRGLYYRPDNCGYTGLKSEAGRYHESEACAESGVTAVHVDEAPMFSAACWDDIKVQHLMRLIAERDLVIEGIAGRGRYLLNRLNDHEVRMTSEADSREWVGHVTPAMERFRSLLASIPTPDNPA